MIPELAGAGTNVAQRVSWIAATCDCGGIEIAAVGLTCCSGNPKCHWASVRNRRGGTPHGASSGKFSWGFTVSSLPIIPENADRSGEDRTSDRVGAEQE